MERKQKNTRRPSVNGVPLQVVSTTVKVTTVIFKKVKRKRKNIVITL